MERHVLVVFPHPDDESFSSAGTIALHTKAGTPVTYACGTLGEMGRNMGKPIFANRETLPLIRKKELEEACKILGINDLRLLGLRDKTIEFEDIEHVADKIELLLHELNPSLVITYYPGQSVHPDHDAMAFATVRAISRLPIEKRPKIHCIAITKNRLEVLGDPDIIVDIREVREQKLEAIKAHRSQTAGMISRWEKEMDNNPFVMEFLNREIFWTYTI